MKTAKNVDINLAKNNLYLQNWTLDICQLKNVGSEHFGDLFIMLICNGEKH